MWTQQQALNRVKQLEVDWGQYRWPYVYKAMRNQNYVEGNQHILWNESTRTFAPLPNNDGRLRLILNWVGNITYGIINLLIKDMPDLQTLPQRPDSYAERLSARASSLLLQALAAKNEMPTRDLETFYGMLTHGLGIQKTIWDDNIGEYMPPETGDEGPQKTGSAKRGDISTTSVPLFNMWWQPGVTYFDESIEYFEKRLLHREIIKDIWEYDPPADSGIPGLWDVKQYMMDPGAGLSYGANGIGSSGGYPSSKELVPVVEYYRRPTKENRGGLRAVMTAEKVLFMGGLERDVRGYVMPFPHTEFKNRYHPYSLVPDAFVTHLLDPQKLINGTFSAFVEQIRIHAEHKYFFDEQAFDENIEEVLSPHPNEAHSVRLSPGQSINDVLFRMRGEAPNNAWTLGLEMGVSQIRELGQYWPFRTGGGIKNVRTSGGLAMVQENADTQSKMWLLSIKRGKERVGKRTLLLAQKYYKKPRLMQYMGRDGHLQVAEFSNADISESTEVVFDLSTRRSTSRIANTQEAITLRQMNIIDPETPGQPRKRTEFMRLAGMSAFSDDVGEEERDRAMAERENLYFLKFAEALSEKGGAPVNLKQQTVTDSDVVQEISLIEQWLASGGDPRDAPETQIIPMPKVYENHTIHVSELNRFRKTAEYEEKVMPHVADIVNLHEKAHSMMEIAQAAQQLAKQAELQRRIEGMVPPQPQGQGGNQGGNDKETAHNRPTSSTGRYARPDILPTAAMDNQGGVT